MFWSKSTLIFGLGYESSLIVQSVKQDAEKFCMDFSRIYYPKGDALTYPKRDELADADGWWVGEYVFEMLREDIFKKLMKGKKTIIIVVTRMGEKEAGFVNGLIKYSDNAKFALIINKNQIGENLYRYFSNICTTLDTFYTDEFMEQIYDSDSKIKPHTSILEMDARLNLSFMKRIEDIMNKRIKLFSRRDRKSKKSEKSFIVEEAEHEAQKIIMDARMEANRILNESELLRAVQREAEKIKQQVIAECEEIKRRTLSEIKGA